MGIFYGIGVGPGNPELMTLQAVRIIKECNVIAVPDSGVGESVALQIAKQAVPEIQEKKILYLSMPMTKDNDFLNKAHEKASQELFHYLKNSDVAFLTIGDVSIYSTYLYLHKKISNLGVKTIMVPGIPSFCAAAAALNDSLVEGNAMLHLIPATYDISSALQLKGTKVFMKAGKNFNLLKSLLQNNKTAQMVENCGFPSEKIYTVLEEIPDNPGYLSLMIVKE